MLVRSRAASFRCVALVDVFAMGVTQAAAKTTTKTRTFNQCLSGGTAVTDHSGGFLSTFVTVPKKKK